MENNGSGRRKAIQLAQSGKALVALCDDGTMWLAHPSAADEWRQVAGVPQRPANPRATPAELAELEDDGDG